MPFCQPLVGVALAKDEETQKSRLLSLTLGLGLISFLSGTAYFLYSAPAYVYLAGYLYSFFQLVLYFLLLWGFLSAFWASQVTVLAASLILTAQVLVTGGQRSPMLGTFSYLPVMVLGRMPAHWIQCWTVLFMFLVAAVTFSEEMYGFSALNILSPRAVNVLNLFLHLLVIGFVGTESVRFSAWSYSMIECLREEKRLANQANEAKSQFLAVMSHEIRTPLQGVIGWVDLLLTEPSLQMNQETHSKLIYLGECCSMLKEVVSNILDFSKIQEGKLQLENTPFSVSDVVDSMVSSISSDCHRIQFSILLVDIPAVVVGPYCSIKQCLSNLITNAVKFTSEGDSITVSCTGRLVHYPHHRYSDGDIELTFEIADTGIGITEEAQRELFTAFQQADLSTTRTFGGTGLGLAIVKNLAHLMGGDAWCVSHFGVGSSFFFSTMVKTTHEEPELITTSPSLHPILLPHGNAPILVVDDNKMNQLFLKAALKQLRIPFIQAWDGLQAIEKFETKEISLILMDLHMPKMNGYDATSRIRQKVELHGDTIPVIAMTADAQESIRSKILACKFSDFISKPFSVEKLSSCLKKWIGTVPTD